MRSKGIKEASYVFFLSNWEKAGAMYWIKVGGCVYLGHVSIHFVLCLLLFLIDSYDQEW